MIYLVERFELFVQRRLVAILQKLSTVVDLLLPFDVFQFDRFQSERTELDDEATGGQSYWISSARRGFSSPMNSKFSGDVSISKLSKFLLSADRISASCLSTSRRKPKALPAYEPYGYERMRRRTRESSNVYVVEKISDGKQRSCQLFDPAVRLNEFDHIDHCLEFSLEIVQRLGKLQN